MIGPKDLELHDHETYESKGKRDTSEPLGEMRTFESRGERTGDEDENLNVN